MGKSKAFTNALIQKLSFEKDGTQQDIRWDDCGISGFGVRVYPSNKKTFVLFYRAWSEEKQMRVQRIKVLGTFGEMTVEQARVMAQDIKSQINVDRKLKGGRGRDPLEAAEIDQKHAISFREFCSLYIERHAKVHKKSWTEDQRRIDKYLLPAFEKRRLTAITRADVAQLHGKLGTDKPYMANRVIEQVSKMFELARVWGYLQETAPNPARNIPAFREHKRDRWITPEELPKLAAAINEEQNVSGRNALWLYLLTGLRRDELLTARWDDIDWNRKELRLADTKAGRVHYVPLSEPAIALLQNMPRDAGNPYLLPGEKPGSHLVNIEKIWRRVRKAAGVEDVRLHDLRRTVGSWLAQSGNSLHLIGRVLNHSSQSTTAVYARFGQDHVRSAIEHYGGLLMETAKQPPIAHLVPNEPNAKATNDTRRRNRAGIVP